MMKLNIKTNKANTKPSALGPVSRVHSSLVLQLPCPPATWIIGKMDPKELDLLFSMPPQQ